MAQDEQLYVAMANPSYCIPHPSDGSKDIKFVDRVFRTSDQEVIDFMNHLLATRGDIGQRVKKMGSQADAEAAAIAYRASRKMASRGMVTAEDNVFTDALIRRDQELARQGNPDAIKAEMEAATTGGEETGMMMTKGTPAIDSGDIDIAERDEAEVKQERQAFKLKK